tara:strand:- start:207 stop:1193 length:987 start_codon:yes stop_codon:yes gene_type:complete
MAEKYINFVINGMTSLRYFIPLTEAAHLRGIKSRYFTAPSGKYNCPMSPKNYSILQEYSELHNFEILNATVAKQFEGDFFLIEGDGVGFLGPEQRKYSISYMTDYITSYDRYINHIDYAIFPSKFVSSLCDTPIVEEKSLYLGSPKYDVSLSRTEILNKYQIKSDKKKAFVIMPRTRDRQRVDFQTLYGCLRKLGFDIVTKTRGKDPYLSPDVQGDYHYMDFSWYPHDSMELIYLSDIVINFSSTAIKECALLRKPVVNFHVKPHPRRFDEFYDYEYCIELGNDFSSASIERAIEDLTTKDLSTAFDLVQSERLFKPGLTSEKILDIL